MTNELNNKNDWLLSNAKDVFSQKGEDGIVEKIFEIIKTENKWCVEFGAWDGKHLSNSYNLIKNHNWFGVYIEASKERFKDLLATHQGNDKIVCLNKFVDFSGENKLDNLLAATSIPRDFDLLCIDIDGNDYHIWDSVELYQPRVVIIEFNPSIPPDIEFVQPKDMKKNQGSSLLSLCNLGKKKGYELVSATLLNAFFVKKEYFDLFKINNNTPQELFRDSRYYTRLFQLYDGTVVLDGCDKLMWHGIKIKQQQLQFLPKFFRIFPEMMKSQKKILFRAYRKIKNYF